MPPEAPTSEAASPLPPRRVLLVDDEPVILMILNGFLTDCVEECAEAGNGLEALEKLQTGNFDLIITDRTMPHMDGMTLCREAKKLSPELKVLLISGMITEQELPAVDEGGPDGFLHKPFTRDQLLQGIAKLFGRG